MYERVKESLGELLTAEEARQLVDKVIQESLLSPEIKYNSYGSKVSEGPAPFVTLVRAAVDPMVKEAINEWIAANPDEVRLLIEGALKDGLLSAMAGAIKLHLSAPLSQLQASLYQVINKIGGV